jgi:hypothetical protein
MTMCASIKWPVGAGIKNLFPKRVSFKSPQSHISMRMQRGREWVRAESVLTLCAHTIIIMPKKPAQMNGEMRLWRNGKGERDATHPHTHNSKELFCIA